MNKTVKKKVNFINSSQNEGLFPPCLALSFNRFGSISWHSICFVFVFLALLQFSQFFSPRISNFFGLSTTDETWWVEMRIWCIKIGIVLVFTSDSSTSRDYNSQNRICQVVNTLSFGAYFSLVVYILTMRILWFVFLSFILFDFRKKSQGKKF
jgi:hypothetical protein